MFGVYATVLTLWTVARWARSIEAISSADHASQLFSLSATYSTMLAAFKVSYNTCDSGVGDSRIPPGITFTVDRVLIAFKRPSKEAVCGRCQPDGMSPFLHPVSDPLIIQVCIHCRCPVNMPVDRAGLASGDRSHGTSSITVFF